MCAVIRAFPGLQLGVTSIGLDGEDLDTVSFLPKPKVALPEGSLVVTAQDCLKQSQAGLQILENLGLRTGMGDILLVRVTKPGNVLLGGPSTVSGITLAREALLAHGAQKLLIDGAFARQAFAMAGDAMVYVVGAHRSPVLEQVVDSAALALRRYALPGVLPQQTFLHNKEDMGWLDESFGFHPLPFASTLGQTQALLQAIPGEASWLYLPGVLHGQLASQLVQQRDKHHFGLVLKSPLSLVMEDTQLRHLFLLHRPIRVLYPLTLAFVAINPVSPAGYAFDAAKLRSAMAGITQLPLINAAEELALEPDE